MYYGLFACTMYNFYGLEFVYYVLLSWYLFTCIIDYLHVQI
jgi:hypothetical protein